MNVCLNFPKQEGLVVDNGRLNSGNLTNKSINLGSIIRHILEARDGIHSGECVVGRSENGPVLCQVEESSLERIGHGGWWLRLGEWTIEVISTVDKVENKWLNWSRLVPDCAIFIEDFPTCSKCEVASVEDVLE